MMKLSSSNVCIPGEAMLAISFLQAFYVIDGFENERCGQLPLHSRFCQIPTTFSNNSHQTLETLQDFSFIIGRSLLKI
jgi:hypothetical protein